MKKTNVQADATKKFANLIYRYALNEASADDEKVNIFITDFKFDDVMIYRDDKKTWTTDTETFKDLVRDIQACVMQTCHPNSIHYRSKTVWKIAKHLVERANHRVSTKPANQKFPWGDNWYQFSITYPLFLVIISYIHMRLFKEKDQFLLRVLSSYIQGHFYNPETYGGVGSLGWVRKGPNAVMMAVPYIGGKLLLKDYDPNDLISQYVKDYCTLHPAVDNEGLYPDFGFIFHTYLRAYGYIYSAYNDMILISNFFGGNVQPQLTRVFNIFQHPSIQRHFSPLFTRSSKCETKVKGGLLGFFVVDSVRAVAVKQEKWSFCFFGQADHLCYYEADKDDNKWALIWLGARVFFYGNRGDEKWHQELSTYYPGIISYNNKKVEIQSSTTTTETHMPEYGKTMIASFADVIAVRNSYKVAHVNYTMTVVEMCLITKQGHHSYYQIKVDEAQHAQDPVVISLNLGVQKAHPSGMVGGQDNMSFEHNNTFVYYKMGKTSQIKTKHPRTDKDITVFQFIPELEPVTSSDGTSELIGQFGYSTTHELQNELYTDPSATMIRTLKYTMHYDEKTPDHLWLYKTQETPRVAVTRVMAKTYESSLSIPIKMIQDKFGDNFKTGPQTSTYKDSYRCITNNRFQMIFNNVKLPYNIMNQKIEIDQDNEDDIG